MSKFNFCYADMLQSAYIDLFYSGTDGFLNDGEISKYRN